MLLWNCIQEREQLDVWISLVSGVLSVGKSDLLPVDAHIFMEAWRRQSFSFAESTIALPIELVRIYNKRIILFMSGLGQLQCLKEMMSVKNMGRKLREQHNKASLSDLCLIEDK